MYIAFWYRVKPFDRVCSILPTLRKSIDVGTYSKYKKMSFKSDSSYRGT